MDTKKFLLTMLAVLLLSSFLSSITLNPVAASNSNSSSNFLGANLRGDKIDAISQLNLGENNVLQTTWKYSEIPTTVSIGGGCFSGYEVMFVQASCTVDVTVGNDFGTNYPTGTVTFSTQSTDGGSVELSATYCTLQPSPRFDFSACSIDSTGKSVGTVELQASYSGDSTYLPGSGTVTMPVLLDTPFIWGFCGLGPYGSVDNCTVTLGQWPNEIQQLVAPYPSGQISQSASGTTFAPSSCSLSGNGEGSCSFYNTTDVSSYSSTIDFTYSGDSNYYGSSVRIEANNGVGGAGTGCFPIFIGTTCTLSDISLSQTNSNGGSVVILCQQQQGCSMTGTSVGVVALQGSFGTFTTEVIDNLTKVFIDCSPNYQNQASQVYCGAADYGGPVGTVSWSSTSASGSFSPSSTCQLNYTRNECSVIYSDTVSGFPSITASFSGPNAYPSSGTAMVPIGGGTSSSTATVESTTNVTAASSLFSTSSSQQSTSQSCSVNLQETGLKSGTSWSVNLGGKSSSSTGNTVSFPVSSGSSYSFSIPDVVGSVTGHVSTTSVTSANLHGNGTVNLTVYRPLPSSGIVSSNGCGGAVHVYFYAEKYSCNIGVSLAASSTTTTSSTRAALSTCSAIVPLKVTGGNISIPQFSNIAIGSDGRGAYDVSFTLTGKSGTFGTSTISIPKNDVPTGLAPVVYVNGTAVSGQSYTEDANYYYVTFTTHFSTDSIDILFTSGSNPSPFNITGLLPYIATGVAVVVILGTSLFLFSKRRTNSRQLVSPKSSICRNCGAPVCSDYAFCRKCGKRP